MNSVLSLFNSVLSLFTLPVGLMTIGGVVLVMTFVLWPRGEGFAVWPGASGRSCSP